ncbi:MAG: hypothetical protein ACLP81_03285, partial [Acidimicrobiales bacterium]
MIDAIAQGRRCLPEAAPADPGIGSPNLEEAVEAERRRWGQVRPTGVRRPPHQPLIVSLADGLQLRRLAHLLHLFDVAGNH